MNTLRNTSFNPVAAIPHGTLVAGELHWSDEMYQVTAAGIPVLLRPVEFRLLGQLMRQAGRV